MNTEGPRKTQLGFLESVEPPKVQDLYLGRFFRYSQLDRREIHGLTNSAISPAKIINLAYANLVQTKEKDMPQEIPNEKLLLGLAFDSLFSYLSHFSGKDLLDFMDRKNGQWLNEMKRKSNYPTWWEKNNEDNAQKVVEWLKSLGNNQEDIDLLYFIASKALLASYSTRDQSNEVAKLPGIVGFRYGVARDEFPKMQHTVLYNPDALSRSIIQENKLSISQSLPSILVQLGIARLGHDAWVMENVYPQKKGKKKVDSIPLNDILRAQNSFSQGGQFENNTFNCDCLAYSFVDGILVKFDKLDLYTLVQVLEIYSHLVSLLKIRHMRISSQKKVNYPKFQAGIEDISVEILATQDHLREYLRKYFVSSTQEITHLGKESGNNQVGNILGKNVEELTYYESRVCERLKILRGHQAFKDAVLRLGEIWK